MAFLRAAAILAPLLLATLAGCSGDGAGPFLVLRYTLTNETDESMEASPGPHCGTARLEDGRLTLEGSDADALRGGPGLVVLPRLEGKWSTLGQEGYALPFPAHVSIDPGASAPWTRIEAAHGGTGWSVRVDGEAVALPHLWSFDGPGWRVDATLDEGPTGHRTFRMTSCA